MERSPLEFETLAAHAGLSVRVAETIATVGPISASTTFTYDSLEEVHGALGTDPKGFAYARNANPTVKGLEEALCLLEGAEDVIAFGSGMAALHAALLALGLEPDDIVIASEDLYGVTRSLLAHLLQVGIGTVYVDVFNRPQLDDALKNPKARVLLFETITNPLVRVPDVDSLIRCAKQHRKAVLIDNTFATPYLLRPLAYGADMVMHSATKYIAGHGDVVAGVVATNRSYGQRVRGTRTITGGVLSPFEAWLTLRGLRTLPVRLARQSDTALLVAQWLSEQPWIQHVHYPGLQVHSQHELAGRQFGRRYGGLLAFDLAAPQNQVLAFLDALRVITAGTSLGDVESLALYPRLTSHRNLTEEELQKTGIGEGLVRLSVGLESPRDLQADLEQAARKSGIVGAGYALKREPVEQSG